MGELKIIPETVSNIWSQYQNPRRINRVNIQLVRYNTEYHRTGRTPIQVLGASQQEKAIVKIAAKREIVKMPQQMN